MVCVQAVQEISQSKINSNQSQFLLAYQQFVINTRTQFFHIYKLSTLIHRSNSTIIREVIHKGNHQKRVCKIKVINNFKQLSALKEIEALKMFEHPNIVRIHEYFIQNQELYIILEKIQGKNLKQWLKQKKIVDIQNVIEIMKQISLTICTLHSKNIAHRAINPNHIMIEQNKDKILVKIIDFYWSESIDIPKHQPVRHCRHIEYNSKQSVSNPLQHDIYCCGLIFMLLLGGKNQKQTIDEFMDKNIHLRQYETFLRQILTKNPYKRLNSFQMAQFFCKTNIQSQNFQFLIKSMLKFNVKGSLKNSLWMFATINFSSHAHKLQFLNQFYFLDANKDGKIQFSQMVQGIQNILYIEKQKAILLTQAIFKKLDKNMDGQINFYQFMLGYYTGRNLTDSQLHLIFKEIDSNQDGIISQQQLNEAIQGVEDFMLLQGREGLKYQQFKQIMQNYFQEISENDKIDNF